jgi:PPOX class probable FMN-dependent enzyme
MNTDRFAEIVDSEERLRAVMGHPMPRAVKKEIASLDVHCRAFISRSPFVLISSCDAQGRMDISPKGDPPGFVQVLDDRTLAIPDRPGNRRADTFVNVLQNPRVGLLFIIPGKQETLRVNGRGIIVRDLPLRERMAVGGKLPQLALVVSVEQAFVHCAKCMIRSHLWDTESWPDPAGLPSHAHCLVDQAKLAETVEEIQASIDQSYKTRLY